MGVFLLISFRAGIIYPHCSAPKYSFFVLKTPLQGKVMPLTQFHGWKAGAESYLRIIRQIYRGPDPHHPFSLDFFPWMVGCGRCMPGFGPARGWIQGEGSSLNSQMVRHDHPLEL